MSVSELWSSLRSSGALSLWRETALSLGLFVAVSLVARIHSTRLAAHADLSPELRRSAQIRFRNGLGIALIAALFFVWAGEIRAALLSIAAIAAAILIVSKEVISGLFGAALFALTKPAKIGDSIELGAFRGELVDHNWAHLSLLEQSPRSQLYTGRLVRVPISLLLTAPLVNLSFSGRFRFCSLDLHVRQEIAFEALELAVQCAEQVSSSWIEQAHAHALSLERSHWIEAPDTSVRASLSSFDKDSALISLRFPCPAEERSRAEAAVQSLYFQRLAPKLIELRAREKLASSSVSSSSVPTSSP